MGHICIYTMFRTRGRYRGHCRYLRPVFHPLVCTWTLLVVSTLNPTPSIGHSGKVRVVCVCCKMKESSSNKKIDKHFRSLEWNMPIFLQEWMGVDTYTFQVRKFPAECRQEKSIHPAARFDFFRWDVHTFARQVYTFQVRLKECSFSLRRLHRPCLGCWFVSETCDGQSIVLQYSSCFLFKLCCLLRQSNVSAAITAKTSQYSFGIWV